MYLDLGYLIYLVVSKIRMQFLYSWRSLGAQMNVMDSNENKSNIWTTTFVHSISHNCTPFYINALYCILLQCTTHCCIVLHFAIFTTFRSISSCGDKEIERHWEVLQHHGKNDSTCSLPAHEPSGIPACYIYPYLIFQSTVSTMAGMT